MESAVKTKLIFLSIIFFLPIFNTFAEGDSSVENKPAQNQTGLEELPPDPGEAGKATLEGIDSDNDGVRDDLQRYIALTYPDSEKIRRVLTEMIKADTALLLNAEDKAKVLEIDKLSSIDSDNDGVRDDLQRYIALTYPDSEKIRRVLTEMIKADTALLLNAEDKAKVLEIDKLSSKAFDCSWYIDPKTATQRHRKLKAKMLNTEARIRAWIRVNSHFGGMTFNVRLPEEEKAQCGFDPDTLPN